MSRLIQNLQIKNFKSIRDLSLECDRINIFIGKPNAGKSNILEAISLLGAGYSGQKFMDGFIRYKTITQLFSNFNFQVPIQIRIQDSLAKLETSVSTNDFLFSISHHIIQSTDKGDSQRQNLEAIENAVDPFSIPYLQLRISANGMVQKKTTKSKKTSPVKKYEFISLAEEYQERGFFLQPPHGENFYLIAQGNKDLRAEIQQFLKPNGLEFLLDIDRQQMSVVQKTETSLLSFPMHLVPDTFQRYIFHLAAIMSNRDSVLLFEEPESHSYMPYVYQLAQQIVDDEGGNQYFITTHNPYLLTPILQETKDVALFVTWFENYETHARRLSEQEIGDILNYGLDVFLNLDHFIPNEPSPDFA